jgi:hypothetical protein
LQSSGRWVHYYDKDTFLMQLAQVAELARIAHAMLRSAEALAGEAVPAVAPAAARSTDPLVRNLQHPVRHRRRERIVVRYKHHAVARAAKL